MISKKDFESNYPLTWKYLNKNKNMLESREDGSFKDQNLYRFGRTQNLGMWEQHKLLVPYMIKQLCSYYDNDGNYYFVNVTTGGYGVTIDDSKITYNCLCALLNSRLLDFYLKQVSTTFHGGYFAANKQYIEKLPIVLPEILQEQKMVSSVEKILSIKKKLLESKISGSEKERLGQQIKNLDYEIDQEVYKLYGITKEEQRIIEEILE